MRWRPWPSTVLILLVAALGCSAPARAPRGAGSPAPPDHPLPAASRPGDAVSADTPGVAAAPAAVTTDAGTADPHEDAEDVDDEVDLPVVEGEARPHPLRGVTDEELARRVHADLPSLGSMSLGRPSGGGLVNAVRMPEGPAWRLVDPEHAWGTEETTAYLSAALTEVAGQFPDTAPLPIGHISARRGGPLAPHVSHQSGRDVDLGYYYRGDDPWYRRATAENLDVERTWALLRALVVHTDVEMILIDRSLQALLRAHAASIGEPEAWLDDLFVGRGPRGALIRHARGHATHLHVRFFNPTAQETARRCTRALVDAGLVEPPVHYVQHRARKGETLGKLAKRYGTTVRAIQRANGLRSTLIQAKKTYRIPRAGPAPGESSPVRVPERRLPPG